MKARFERGPVPAEIQFILAFAGRMLPRSLRREWSREWLAEFSDAFRRDGDRCARQRWRMLTRAFGAFPDIWALLQLHGIRRGLAETAHSRVTPVIVSVLVLHTLALSTKGFQQARGLLFQPESDKLVVLVQRVPFMGGSSRVPLAQAELWGRTGTTVERLGAWTVEHRTIQGRGVRVWRVTPAALELFAQSRIRPQHDFVEISGTTSFAGIIAKLRPAATIRDAEDELAQTTKLRKGWLRPQVISLASIRRAPLVPVGWLLAGLWLICVASIRVRSLNACFWAVVPRSLCFIAIACAWLECVARAPVTEAGGIPEAWNVVLYVIPAAAGSFAVWTFHRDAVRRCRMCYRPLMAGVSIGIEGRCIFEPGGSEYLCAEGHGSLVVGFAAQNNSDEVWIPWSGSWA